MKIVKADKKGLAKAVRELKKGKSVVYPTDTTYGLAVDATNVSAVRRLYKVKGRNFNKPVHIVVPSLVAAKKIVSFNKPAEKLFKNFLPGPLTLVLPLVPTLSRKGGEGAHALLSARTGKLGIRVPKNKIALNLVRKLGRPITATSANVSGGPDCYSIAEIIRQFKNKRFKLDLILDAGTLKRTKPSTVVDLSGQNVKILRSGPVSKARILNALKHGLDP